MLKSPSLEGEQTLISESLRAVGNHKVSGKWWRLVVTMHDGGHSLVLCDCQLQG